MNEKLIDLENAPAFDSSCSPYCDSGRSINAFSKQLLYTPHYKLPELTEFNQLKIESEINSINHLWAPYNNDVLKKRGAGFSQYWSAIFLRNFDKDPSFGFGETLDYLQLINKQHIIKDGRVEKEFLMQTSAYYQCPSIVSIIDQLVTLEECDRILLSRVDRGERVNWHSHCSYEKKYTHAYIHIPLISNKSTKMYVYMNNQLYSKNYPTGEAWIINTQHNHAVDNPDNMRYHLLILASFKDKKFCDLLRASGFKD